MSEDHAGLIAEIKLILQEELAVVYKAIHAIDIQMSDFKARVVERPEFERIMNDERVRSEAALTNEQRRTDKALYDEIKKREDSDKALILLKEEVSNMKTSNKIYLTIAAAIVTTIAGGIATILFGLVG